jgi:putative membrane protein
MRRRTLLTALAAAGVSSTALAQNRTQQHQTQPGEMGKAETDHMQRTMKTGSLALATSQVAMQKAQNPRLKQFAQFEVAEQQTVAEVLKSMQNEQGTVGAPARPAAQEAQPQLGDRGRAMPEKLNQTNAGADFDREYLQGQIQGHRELLDAQEDYIRAGRHREHVNVAKLARGQIKEHLAILDLIQGELGRRG